MRRPGSVLAVVILQLFGAVVVLGLAAQVWLGALSGRMISLAAGSSEASLLAIALLLAVFAAWGVATALGMLWLRSWALVSTLLFSLLLLAEGIELLSGAIAAALAGSAVGVIGGMSIGPLFAGIAVWWIVFCVRPETRQEIPVPRLPLSLAVTGWALLGGGGLAIAWVPLFAPQQGLALAGHVVPGRTAQIEFVVIGGISMVVGLGLLEQRRWARPAAVAWMVLLLVDFAISWLVAAAAAGMSATTVSLAMAACLAAIYFLGTRKAAAGSGADAGGSG